MKRQTIKTITLQLALAALCLPGAALAKAKQVDDTHWTGVERVIAIGDIHGDFDQYMAVLREAGLVDKRGKWTGGDTHLVQTGDVPDRGPDTKQILEHLEKLKKEAKRKGGYIHTLIGNHEAMNIYGDLRYVTPGEFAAYEGRNSKRLQDAQFERQLSILESRDPDAFKNLDPDAYRAEWEKDFPLGWVEYRTAWLPDGEVGKKILENPVVLKIDDTLFLHGGLSAKYCEMSLEDITDQVHDELKNYDWDNPGMIEDPLGPLWYRGLAMDDEEVRRPMVDAILERYDASRIVVGHTPTQGVVWPRFDGRVVLNDLGMAAYYGGHVGWLEITGDSAVAHYAGGNSAPLPGNDADREGYLEQVVAWHPSNAYLKARLGKLRAAPEPAPEAAEAEALSEEEAAAKAQEAAWLSPDNCR